MTNEEKIQELANIISPIAQELRHCDCVATAKKLVELGYEKKSETAKEILQEIIDIRVFFMGCEQFDEDHFIDQMKDFADLYGVEIEIKQD